MASTIKARISSWNPGRGFGFCQVDGRRVFVHSSVLSPRPARGSNLTDQQIMVREVEWEAQKGPRVIAAETLEEHDRQKSLLQKKAETARLAKEAQVAVRASLEEARLLIVEKSLEFLRFRVVTGDARNDAYAYFRLQDGRLGRTTGWRIVVAATGEEWLKGHPIRISSLPRTAEQAKTRGIVVLPEPRGSAVILEDDAELEIQDYLGRMLDQEHMTRWEAKWERRHPYRC